MALFHRVCRIDLRIPRSNGFTLAEVLITLGIIGIVAAMTLPGLVGNYKKKVTVTRLKAAYTILDQAIKLSEVQNGECTYWEHLSAGNNISAIKTYIAPYMKNTQTAVKQTDFIPFDNGLGSYIELENGTIVMFHTGLVLDIIVDINGLKGPNKYGYDQFVFGLNWDNVSPYPKGFLPFITNANRTLSHEQLVAKCAENGYFCTYLIMHDGWEINKDYPYKF